MALPTGHMIQVIDTITGEVVTQTSNPDASVYMGKKRRHPGGFVIVYESEFRALTVLLAPKGAIPLALSNVLMTKVQIGSGEILVNTVELAELLSTYRPQISKALKLLVDMGIISLVEEKGKIKKDGKHFIYRMNPALMWKGRETERQQVLKLVHGQGEMTKKRRNET
jgi:DNA-binding transcriptional ArsR family regulator